MFIRSLPCLKHKLQLILQAVLVRQHSCSNGNTKLLWKFTYSGLPVYSHPKKKRKRKKKSAQQIAGYMKFPAPLAIGLPVSLEVHMKTRIFRVLTDWCSVQDSHSLRVRSRMRIGTSETQTADIGDLCLIKPFVYFQKVLIASRSIHL